jgi:hypothetical protein
MKKERVTLPNVSGYLNFERWHELERGTTEVWGVISASSGDELGQIRWYGAWRQYVFFPAQHTLFNKTCLADIENVLAARNSVRAEKIRAAKIVRADAPAEQQVAGGA